MEINQDGIFLDTLEGIFSYEETLLRAAYGNDFRIKPDGILENILTLAAEPEIKFQDIILYFAGQYNPDTADNIWQDALYERIGVSRLESRPTTFTKTVTGAAKYTVSAESITIRSEIDNNEFVNISEFSTGENGSAPVDFKALEAGSVSVDETDLFKIVSAPDGITGLGEDNVTNISQGRLRESDDEYRTRFKISKALNARTTKNANLANLTRYVDNAAFLSIIDKNDDLSMESGTVLIIAKHNTTDTLFANAVFDTLGFGVVYQGDTSVTVSDDCGDNVVVKFKNAEEIPMEINASIKLVSGYYEDVVVTNVKKNITSYINKRVFGLEVIIYATEFIIPILETDGVEAVTAIGVKRETDEKYFSEIEMSRVEVPNFSEDKMYFEVSC